jgi:hypothetical protein
MVPETTPHQLGRITQLLRQAATSSALPILVTSPVRSSLPSAPSRRGGRVFLRVRVFSERQYCCLRLRRIASDDRSVNRTDRNPRYPVWQIFRRPKTPMPHKLPPDSCQANLRPAGPNQSQQQRRPRVNKRRLTDTSKRGARLASNGGNKRGQSPFYRERLGHRKPQYAGS